MPRTAPLGDRASRGTDGRRKRSALTASTSNMIDKQFERYEEAWFNFHRYDKDGSGTIETNELISLLADLQLHVGRKDRTAEQMEEWAKREMKKNDANGDGVLAFEEFLEYYNSFVARHRAQIDELYQLSNEVLGKGAFGTVVRGERRETQQAVAVKRLSKASLADSLDLLHNEIAVWEALDHPHLVKLIDVFEDPDNLILITELMRGNDLFKRLATAPDGRFSSAVASRCSAQIIAAVAYLHVHGVVHCDLKPSNILVLEPPDSCELSELTVKVADFGLSQTVAGALKKGLPAGGDADADGAGDDGGDGGDGGAEFDADDEASLSVDASARHSHRRKTLKLVVGTPAYFAPELVALAQHEYGADSYNEMVDNWAIGCVVWELLVGTPPFDADDESILFYKISDATLNFPDYVAADARDLIVQFLQKDPEQRIKCEAAMLHPWLAEDVERMGLSQSVRPNRPSTAGMTSSRE